MYNFAMFFILFTHQSLQQVMITLDIFDIEVYNITLHSHIPYK